VRRDEAEHMPRTDAGILPRSGTRDGLNYPREDHPRGAGGGGDRASERASERASRCPNARRLCGIVRTSSTTTTTTTTPPVSPRLRGRAIFLREPTNIGGEGPGGEGRRGLQREGASITLRLPRRGPDSGLRGYSYDVSVTKFYSPPMGNRAEGW